MQQSNEWMEVTYEEKELLESIRNYNRSFPDGYPELLWFAQELFDNLVRQPYFWTIIKLVNAMYYSWN